MQSNINKKLATLQFLWSSESLLQTAIDNNRNLEVVKNQLRTECLALAQKDRIDCLPVLQSSDICRYCGKSWSDGSYKLKVVQHSKKMKQLRKKLLSKAGSLSVYEKHLLDLFNKRKDNMMVKQCKICNGTMKIGLNKPKNTVKKEESPICFVENSPPKKKKKKKSKSDRYSGLVPSAVITAKQSFGTPLTDGRRVPSLSNHLNQRSKSVESNTFPLQDDLPCSPPLENKNICDQPLCNDLQNYSVSCAPSRNTKVTCTKLKPGKNLQLDQTKRPSEGQKELKNKSILSTGNSLDINFDVTNIDLNSEKTNCSSPRLQGGYFKLNQNSKLHKKQGPFKQNSNVNNKSKKKKRTSAVAEFLKLL